MRSGGYPSARRAGWGTVTTAELHVYANGTTGDDANDGLTALTPKLTLQAVFDLVPDVVKHNVAVHLSGTFSEFGQVQFNKQIIDKVTVVIDGGVDLSVVADDGGSPWVADISSTSSLGLSTAGWVADAYAGYMLEVIDGPAAGQTRLVQSNSTTTITPVRNFSVDPGAAQFRIVKPATVLTNTVGYGVLYIASSNFDTSLGYMFLQNLTLSGTKTEVFLRGASLRQYLSHIVDETTTSGAYITASNAPNLTVSADRLNLSTFAQETDIGYSHAGLGHRNTSRAFMSASGRSFLSIQGSYITSLDLRSFSVMNFVNKGTRIVKISLSRVNAAIAKALTSFANIVNTSGYATTKIGGSDVGILLVDSTLRIGSGVDISGCSSHGIEALHSRLDLDGAVTGTGNGGAGVYAHSNSTVLIKNGSPPTLTGAVGDLSTDGTTEATTWADVDAGDAYNDAIEGVVVKEVA